ncbi:RHS repeat-associated core domain-containing protein [Nonomuraea antimicrobica]|uniref:RHS repeat domain-containing protein n=1 Tax=Nonomuraea antimicrobica TaxID=561173 RepID=UPI0031ED170F
MARDVDKNGAVLRTYGYGYDPAGNPTSATSPEGHVTRQTFDALNRATSLVEPVSSSESITTSFGYDATGARTRLTDGRGNATWTGYNTLGLAETVTEPSTTAHPDAADRTWTHLYDAAGNQTATIQPGGVRTDRTFDDLGRLTKETGAGGGAATAERTFGYDLAGRSTTAGDLTVDYNDRGLPLKVSRGTVQETAYAYDGLGSPLQRIDAAGTATFTYDGANRIKTTTDPVTSRTLTYGYDPASRLKTVTATTGTASTQSIDYDDMDRITGQTLKNGSGTQLASIAYGWDKNDNLTTKTTTGTAGAGTNTYAYDHAGRLTSWTAPGGTTTPYEWDAAGNRTKAGAATFTYDERNRLTSGDGTDYTYTPRGTLATSTKTGSTTSYTFDAFDRLIADGDSLYSYDALDRMTSRTRGTTKNTFTYSGLGNDLAAITDSGTLQATYARDLTGGLLGLKEGTSAAAAFSDLHGDLVGTHTATLQTSTAYDPIGTVTAQTGTKTQLGYQGEYTDPGYRQVNMHARWYQPGTGTFTSRDTATLTPNPSVQANRYTYANASPLTGIDPTGHYTIDSGSLAGVGYGGSGSSGGYTTIPGGGYSSSAASGGQCIGSCGREDIGSGAVACDIQSCGGATVDPSWARMIELENEKKFWLGEDEVERLGFEVMPNGRPVDQVSFWFADEKVQNDYMASWSPTLTDELLAFNWAKAGGLESFAVMERAAKSNPKSMKLRQWREMQNYSATRPTKGYAALPKNTGNGSVASRFKYYSMFKSLLKYHGAITRAAANHGIDKKYLTAVLFWELNTLANKFGAISLTADWFGGILSDRNNPKNLGSGASVGLAQLELYKVRILMMKHYGKKEWESRPLGDYLKEALDPNRAIHLAAAWMRHLKENVWYMKGGSRHYLNDAEAAIAYCGCSGVTVDNPASGNTKLTTKNFRAWAESGFNDNALAGASAATGVERRKKLQEWWKPGGAVDEYWACNRIGWQNCD